MDQRQADLAGFFALLFFAAAAVSAITAAAGLFTGGAFVALVLAGPVFLALGIRQATRWVTAGGHSTL